MQALINGRPEETTALLMRLCTSGEGLGQGGEPAPVTAQVADFAHLFADRCALCALSSLKEGITDNTMTMLCDMNLGGFYEACLEEGS